MDRCLEAAEAHARLSDDDQMLLSADNNTNIHSDNRPISTSSRKNSTSTFGLGQRRNSSFADFFENEDFAQSLLSRRHFTWSHDEREQRGCKKNSDHNFSVNDPGVFVTASSEKKKEASTKKKLSKILPTNWFFSNSDTAPRPERRNRSVSESTESAEEEEESRKVSLSRLIISKRFTASTDVLEINLVAPQSQ